MNSDKDLIFRGHRLFDVLDADDLGRAVSAVNGGFHVCVDLLAVYYRSVARAQGSGGFPAELAVLEGKGSRLSAKELGLLAKRLAEAKNHAEAARTSEQLTRGFYGI